MTLAKSITADNRVVMVMQPEKEGFTKPSEDQLAKVLADVDAETIEAHVDNVKSEPLISTLPTAGSIVAESHDELYDASVWSLSNGATVIVKPTKFKEDEILFTAIAKGGISTLDCNVANLKFLGYVLKKMGLGIYSNVDLNKYTAGKQVGVSWQLDEFYMRKIGGWSTVQDLPTLMELIYMSFTALSLDEKEYASIQNTYSKHLNIIKDKPDIQFLDKRQQSCYKNPILHMLTVDDVKSADRTIIENLCRQMTSNAADYTFIFVGNVNPEALRPLVEQYIASLPSNPDAMSDKIVIDPTLGATPGRETSEFSTEMEVPETHVGILASAEIPYSLKNHQLTSIATKVLFNRLTLKIREEMGAIYGFKEFNGLISRTEKPNTEIYFSFTMNPEYKQEVIDYIASEFKAVENNVRADEVQSAIEFLVKEAKENRERNSAWLSAMEGYQINGIDTFIGEIDALNAITPEDVMEFMKQVNACNNYRVTILDPQ